MGLFYSSRILYGSLGYLFTTEIVLSSLLTDQKHTDVVTAPSQQKQNLVLGI